MSSRGCEVPVPFCSRGCAGSAPPTAPTVIRELGARPTGRPRPSAPRSTEFAVHPHQSQTTTQSLPSARTSVLPTHRRRHPLDRLPPTLAPPRRWCCRSLAVSFPRSREPPREAPVPPMDVWPPLPTHAHPAGGFFSEGKIIIVRSAQRPGPTVGASMVEKPKRIKTGRAFSRRFRSKW